MKLSQERLAEFNGRMNDWISKQGLIFQLTHGGTGLGGRPPIIGSIIRSILSISILALVGVLGYGGYLFWRASGDELPKQFSKGIAASLNVEKVEALGFERDLNSGSYKSLLAQGDDDSFFNGLEVRGVSVPMGLLNGLFGEWDAKTLTIDELNIALKAGDADSERARQSWQSLFQVHPSFTFSKVEAQNVNLTWGYSSPATWGSLLGSEFLATRTETGWDLRFRGGAFSQGIFRHFQVEEITVELDQEGGLKIPSAQMSMDNGTFNWSGEMSSGGASPTFAINGELNNIPIHAFLPRGLLTIIDGRFSGQLTASGSTNTSDGISFQVQALPEGAEGIHLTKELPLLRMLSHLDPQRSYRKIPFTRGSFKIETKGSDIRFDEIDLSSIEEDSTEIFARLQGSFKARPSTPEDLKSEALIFEEVDEEITSGTIGAAPDTAKIANFGDEILKNFRLLQFTNPPQELLYITMDEKGEELPKKRLDLLSRRKFRVPFVLEGEVNLAVAKSAFEKVGELPSVSIAEDEPDLRWIHIPLETIVVRSTKKLSDEWEQAMEEKEERLGGR